MKAVSGVWTEELFSNINSEGNKIKVMIQGREGSLLSFGGLD